MPRTWEVTVPLIERGAQRREAGAPGLPTSSREQEGGDASEPWAPGRVWAPCRQAV